MARVSTDTVTCRTAARFGPSQGSDVAARYTGSSTADRAAADSSCRWAIVAVVADGSAVATLRSSSCSRLTSADAFVRWV